MTEVDQKLRTVAEIGISVTVRPVAAKIASPALAQFITQRGTDQPSGIGLKADRA